MRAISILTIVGGLIAVSSLGRADELTPSKEACLDAYRVSQPLRRDGKLLEARTKLLVCARDPCPAALQNDCVDWLHEVDAKVPSLVVAATDAKGKDVVDVRVVLDDAELTTRLDGRAIDVDPGAHHLRFEHTGAAPVERDLVVHEGEKGRRVEVRFEPLAVTTLPIARSHGETHRPVRWPTLVLGTLGLGGVVVASIVGVTGILARSDLDACKPNCSPDRIQSVRTQFLVADVMGGVSLALVTTAAVLFFVRPEAQVQVSIGPAGAFVVGSF